MTVGIDDERVFTLLGKKEPSPSLPILLDREVESLYDWQAKGLPITYVLDSEGLIRYRAVGGCEFNPASIHEKRLQLVDKK
ncbi:MAG: hypothetical protein JAY99_01850 [Candidatus Thiodiazotropha lotti]|uniref:TlpA family protein disulfide reductase n=1 Tax=Candidatus Thiodiazotropha endoloripes TaxID=1818881 RepID=UPI00114D0BF8|nr:hypothetical protein [Candidatus Thiodiazotropha endoloripes]MCG7903202.1 hypothetical protein [Candidatus Thiodiazotropha weberae]MCG7991220.1 hypothetical protein [Candidatus Thiodiazotropha lotti]MCG7915163.1 hypothetical protein [Candidatus Thiodiazotropha weberae]MCG7998246.1 hypothetical protein [Candidatus Thiodiazotropha lotti]MCW4182875.1 hypothetical protein [Candidatus Thiodiazotropha weberae]